jgi:peroxiredoxin
LRDNYSTITEAGADVVAIGTGNAMYAKAFIDDERIPFTVLVDDDGKAAAAADIRGGIGTLFKLASPSVLKAGARARKSGSRQHKVGDRPMQLGATFVVRDNTLVFEHRDDDVGDHAPLPAVLAALG